VLKNAKFLFTARARVLEGQRSVLLVPHEVFRVVGLGVSFTPCYLNLNSLARVGVEVRLLRLGFRW
jgi:hypothetical protein